MSGKERREDLMTRCGCGAMSYTGGWCFKCGVYRPGKTARYLEERDSAEHGKMAFSHRLSEFGWPPNQWNE